MPAPASSSAAAQSHAEWLESLRQDYARRMALAAVGLSDSDSPSGHASGGWDMGGFQSGFEVTGEAPVYRSLGFLAGGSSEGPSYRNAGRHNGRSSAMAPGALSEQVDAEWKRSLPPLLTRQRAFTVP